MFYVSIKYDYCLIVKIQLTAVMHNVPSTNPFMFDMDATQCINLAVASPWLLLELVTLEKRYTCQKDKFPNSDIILHTLTLHNRKC